MAPSRTPGRSRRDADYSGIGRYGRKTGVTVPDLGPRDEFGLEPVDNLFSSPRKDASPTILDTKDASMDDMELDHSNQPDPSELLASTRRRAGLPPKSRSPIKTSIGSSPRRSVGGLASPHQLTNHTTDRSQGEPFLSSQNRRKPLLYKAGPGSAASHKKSPVRVNGHQASRASSLEASKIRRSSFNFMHETDEDDDGVATPGNVSQQETANNPLHVDNAADMEDQDTFNPEAAADVSPESFSDSSAGAVPSPPDVANISSQSYLRGPGKKTQPKLKSKKSKEGKGIGSTRTTDFGRSSIVMDEKPTRSSNDNSLGRHSEAQATPLMSEAKNNSNTRKRKRPGQRDPTARIRSVQKDRHTASHEANNNEDVMKKSTKSDNNVTKKQSKVQASYSPFREASAPLVLRSGRTSIKPLAFWRGEQIMYEPPKRIGNDLLPGGYMGVDPGRKPAETLLKQTKRRGGLTRNTGAATRSTADIDEHEEGWEIDGDQPGVLTAEVFVWNPDTQTRVEDAHEEIELALAPTALNSRTQWAKGRTFKFGKTLTLPFFHSGIVDLPPGGEKRPKNSRKNHMIFWVFSGRVQVDVSGNVFSVGQGGMWQVPRGKLYGATRRRGEHDYRDPFRFHKMATQDLSTKAIGLRNPGTLCYQAAVLQGLFNSKAFTNWLTSHHQKFDQSHGCNYDTAQCSGPGCSLCCNQTACIICGLKRVLQASRHPEINNVLKLRTKLIEALADMLLNSSSSNEGQDKGNNYPGFQFPGEQDAMEFWDYIWERICSQSEPSDWVGPRLARIGIRESRTCPNPLCHDFVEHAEQPLYGVLCHLADDVKEHNSFEELSVGKLVDRAWSLENRENHCRASTCWASADRTYGPIKMGWITLPLYFPPLLALKLPRARYVEGVIHKITWPVRINSALDLSSYKRQQDDRIDVFHLNAVIAHKGTPKTGHYKAIIKDTRKDWLELDDLTVSLLASRTRHDRIFESENGYPPAAEAAWSLEGWTPVLVLYSREDESSLK